MAIRQVTILYEDQRGPQNRFGLHTFVQACVFDAINGDRSWLERDALKDCRPMKGASNLLKACRDDIDLIASDGRSVFAVFVDDQIRAELKLPARATAARVAQEIRKGCRAPDKLIVVLLQRNTESILTAAGQCDPSLDRTRIERAVRQKLPLERDSIFSELSRERARLTRDCVLKKLPSLKALVDLLCRELCPP